MAFLSRLVPAIDHCSRKWIVAQVLIVMILLPASHVEVFGQGGPPPEYQVKAVFLFNLAQFVQWPAKAFPDPGAPLVIGILGDDPFGGYLDETLRGEKVNNRPLVLQRFRRVAEIRGCHVLFVSRSESDKLEQIFGALHGRGILTVGDSDDFISRGGMIRLVTEKGKIRIRVNMEAVKAANLAISSKLLRLAQPES